MEYLNWTPGAIKYLKLHYPNTRTRVLAKALDITMCQVQDKASELKLKKNASTTAIVPIKKIETIPETKMVQVAKGEYINVASHISEGSAQALFNIYHKQ